MIEKLAFMYVYFSCSIKQSTVMRLYGGFKSLSVGIFHPGGGGSGGWADSVRVSCK